MAEDLAHGDLLCALQVAQAEGGKLVGDRVVPGHRAFVHQHRAQGAGEGLRQRSDSEHGVGAHRLPGLAVHHAVTAQRHHLAVFDDGHGQAGDARLRDHAFGQALDLARLGAEILGGRRGRREAQPRRQRQHGHDKQMAEGAGRAHFLARHDRCRLAGRAILARHPRTGLNPGEIRR